MYACTQLIYTISIYNIKGQLQKTLSNFNIENDELVFNWDMRNLNNSEVSSGIYFYKIKKDNETYSGRFLVIK